MDFGMEFWMTRIDDPAAVDGDPVPVRYLIFVRNEGRLDLDAEYPIWNGDARTSGRRPTVSIYAAGIFVGGG
jgi:hypothetical protein